MTRGTRTLLSVLLIGLSGPVGILPLGPAAATVQAEAAPRSPLERRASDVSAVLRGQRPAAEVFAPVFLAQVSEAQLKRLVQQLEGAHGAFIGIDSVTPNGAHSAAVTLRFARATGHGVMSIEPAEPHRVNGLLVQRFQTANDSLDAVRTELDALPGRVNAWFGPVDGGVAWLEVGADRPLALGSTFKLFVLAATARAVDEGRHRWDEVVPLSVRSYPSGVMQDWPQGAPVTVQSLATLMLQISDNTATDQLIALLGREAVEREWRDAGGDGGRSLPFLMTREFFVLKADPRLRARYASAAEAERRGMLEALPRSGPAASTVAAAFSGAPLAPDAIEWHASPQSLRRILKTLTEPRFATARALLAANRNMTEEAAAGWRYVGFKGGSEPGVLNLTWLLQDREQRWHMLTLGWNNPDAPVDPVRLGALAQRILALPRQGHL